MKSEIEKLTSLLKRTFEKGAWYGPSVQEVLSKVTTDNAREKLNNTHSIIELVTHMTSWRNYVVSRLVGNVDFEVSETMNFPIEKDWAKAKAGLEESQEALMRAVASTPVEKLSELVPNASHRYTYYTLIHGIIHHDIYHTGQISLILKAKE
jgi:uncharacterized damage-inducible protein DinB